MPMPMLVISNASTRAMVVDNMGRGRGRCKQPMPVPQHTRSRRRRACESAIAMGPIAPYRPENGATYLLCSQECRLLCLKVIHHATRHVHRQSMGPNLQFHGAQPPGVSREHRTTARPCCYGPARGRTPPQPSLLMICCQQFDILGASPNWLGRPYWPSGAACYRHVDVRTRSWALSAA
jgi:hypothetical protein